MKFTLSWLKDHLETTATVAEIAQALTALGLEVEGVDDPAARLEGFVVGEVLEAGPHPDADRLKLCRVADGGPEPLQIVCGAPNARAGIKVVLARPGQVIPESGQPLKVGRIRGVESRGMMCSARELLMGEDHSGIIELAADVPVGAPAAQVMKLDPVFDVAITPDRADCLGVRGIARDLAAAGLGTYRPKPVEPVAGQFESPIGVAFGPSPEMKAAAPVFVGRYVRGVTNRESPAWLKDRLTAVGLRPISALVDITNLITLDDARPLHVFDADKLTGPVGPRMAREGETLDALNEKTYTLTPEMVVIADAEKAHAIGGVMGGMDSACDEGTTNVFIESALFDAARTARTGRALGLDSDARHRFERGVDPESCLRGCEMATGLILELCGGEASQVIYAGQPPSWKRFIAFRPARVAALGGVEVPEAEQVRILTDLGFDVQRDAEPGVWTVATPSWRGDVEGEPDVVEEILRVRGFDHIPAVPMPRDPMPKPMLTDSQRRENATRRGLAARGLMEAVTWSFMGRAQSLAFGGGAEDLTLVNPISSDLDQMRPSILPNLIAAAGRNAARGFPDLGLFEIGPVFTAGTPGAQRPVAAILRAGRSGPRHWRQPPRAWDVFDAKADALAALAAAGAPVDSLQVSADDAPGFYHPGRSGCLRLGPKVLATFGELHPRVLAELDYKGPQGGAVVGAEVFLDQIPLPKRKGGPARPLLKASALQPLSRDFAFVLDEAVPASKLVAAIRGVDKKLIVDVGVFDLYQGEHLEPGRKSLAVSVTLQPSEATLTDPEIEAIGQRIVAAAEKATGATLRG
ncbi:phenylalanine--tRNA ligase subunit beta [Roseospirillum parvum]|uniref:Phenylalanine--tRNA ligase beta subunit n=1 Tax=Roseospirillum parvum TaxID=83401 RepID=A0A1G7UU34_9PROT|nr:phenylalanine--tRNA ligase subunit beta [Roseospirillum parvum]SDG51007.1 phenylalanyl-tRNA synthetase beta chain [Roseospirillum parvum]